VSINNQQSTIKIDLPSDYDERVYAGILGKLIGVYLGRPIENWTYERITRELGEVTHYVNSHPRVTRRIPIVVSDDDVTGTFTFLRALCDYGATRSLTPAQIGQTWLNYLIERTTILWWGGMGNSTEHTAYVRLKNGIAAPRSGSMALNGQVVAEQIGAQIFIDGWAMVAPGDPELAADLAGRAASVSHDGAAIHAAQALAAMEAQAFSESNLDSLFETGLRCIPRDSLITRLITDVRGWCAQDEDWRHTRERIEKKYGYDQYGGGCHMVPNHAIVMLALAYAPDDFQRALMIANTSGWDTDCNSGNVGCMLGIKNGLRGIDSSPVDWRGPIADRLYLPTADGGRCISDAVQETYRITALGRALAGQPQLRECAGAQAGIALTTGADGQPRGIAPTTGADGQPQGIAPTTPKGGARFHFALPGSLQGFKAETGRIENVAGHSATDNRALAIFVDGTAVVHTATFISREALTLPGYSIVASPTLYPGQTIRAAVSTDVDAAASLLVDVYGADDKLERMVAAPVQVSGDAPTELSFAPRIAGGSPIARVGLQITTAKPGAFYLDWLTWSGAPDVTLTGPFHIGTMWQHAWVKACDDTRFERGGFALRACQDDDNGLLIQGEREWANYAARCSIVPHLAKSAGLAVCVQGTRRYYALVLCDDQHIRLIKALDGRHVLAETPFAWTLDGIYDLQLATRGDHLLASIADRLLFDLHDTHAPLLSGAVALLIDAGRLDCNGVTISAV
jgi:ADP-ribosylglycohydrolase